MKKKIRQLVEEHLNQNEEFDDNERFEEDSLVKSTVNDLLEGNIDASYENSTYNVKRFNSKVFPLEDVFSTRGYSGRKISRKSLEFENEKSCENSQPTTDAEDDEFSIKEQGSQMNVRPVKLSGQDDKISKFELIDNDQKPANAEKIPVNEKKRKVTFNLPTTDSENSSEEQDASEEEVDSEEGIETDLDGDESEIEDDVTDEHEEDHSSFLYSKNFKDEPSEVEKGIVIRNQLSLWEVMLESRILLQKCLLTSNKLPKCQKFNQVSSQFSLEEKEILIECKEKVWDLLEKLIQTQDKLRRQNKEFLVTRLKNTELDCSDDDSNTSMKPKRRKLGEYSEVLREKYNEYIPYRDSIIQKWNDRTKMASGKLAKSNFSAFDQPVLKQIEQIMIDKHRLIQRTYLKRSQYISIGEETAENLEGDGPTNLNFEIFDEDDFYHKLLRDYIERKTSDISDPTQLGRKWIQLQSLRSKMKRKIDTRRTKGRKIKFDVHPKLINFMAPVAVDCWENNAIHELYNSVFGKNLINT